MSGGPTLTPPPLPGQFFDDPCGTYKKLLSAYQSLASGEKIARTEYHGGGQERHLEFSVPNISQLRDLMNKAYDECQRINGNTNPRRRHAIMGGSRRRSF